MSANMDNCPIHVKDNLPIGCALPIWQIVHMDRDAFRRRMIEAQDLAGMSTRELSRRSGVSYDALAKLRQGKSRSTSVENARAISTVLGISVDDLQTSARNLPVTEMPLIGPVSAGVLLDLKALSDVEHEDTIRIADLPPGKWCAFRVDGDSMDRISPPESIILVDLEDRALVRNACYIVADGLGGATYKRYRADPDRFEPVSVNTAHETIFPENTPQILGRVRRTMLSL